jgi:predicted RNA-binding Zn-ribbon protein involved in translation (DUF1610 family)
MTTTENHPRQDYGACTGDRSEHCWHHTGVVLMSDPPQDEYVCCHCGEKKYIRRETCRVWSDDPSKHGPHAPQIIASLCLKQKETDQ